ncbi:MAG: DinB family protein [Aggregatilineales bacterium]
MPTFLVTQLRFVRSKWLEGLADVSAEDATTEIAPMNTISWMIAHLTSHERYMWVQMAQGRDDIAPEMAGYLWGTPRANPPLQMVWDGWHTVTQTADVYLDAITEESLLTKPLWQGRQFSETIGNLLLRNIYHYWYHLGEAQSVRQMLGHSDLPPFVGSMPLEFQFVDQG